MFWVERIPDLFGFGWIFEKIIEWKIRKEFKKFEDQLGKEKGNASQKNRADELPSAPST